jgi:thiol-disulfide isomerase/thioredoxin
VQDRLAILLVAEGDRHLDLPTRINGKNSEGQVVRVVPYVGLMALCLVGCSTFGKKSNPPPRAPADTPFAPKPSGGVVMPPPDPLTAAPGNSGILAGQIIDSYNRQPAVTYIQVTAATEKGEPAGAPIEVRADRGFFTIPGLQAGRHYQLTARAQDGSRILAGTTWATPPNPKVLIRISEDFASGTTPPLPPPPAWPGAAGSKGPAPGPAAELGAPRGVQGPDGDKYRSGVPPSPPAGQNNSGADSQAVDKSRTIRIESPAEPRKPPKSSPESDWRPAASFVPAGPALADQPPASGAPTPVPSCVLTGNQLHNFALPDVKGQPWEFRSAHRGRLVLIDFWGTWCPACLYAIPHLTILQDRYGRYGLEVIGIDYEHGPAQEQAQKVNRVRQRLAINYRVLLGTDNPDEPPRCPVRTQFAVSSWPTVILVDENSRIIWRSEGLDAQKLQELEIIIKQQLGVR